jgi:AraC-like DNA-binding protein
VSITDENSQTSRHEPSTLAGFLLPIAKALRLQGVDPMSLLEDAGIDPAFVINNDRRIPASRMRRLLAAAVQETGDEAFGLLAAEQVQPALLQGLGLAVLASDTLYAALQRLVRFCQVLSTGLRLRLEDREEFTDLYIADHRQADREPGAEYALDFGIGLIVVMCRLTLGEYFAPAYIETRRSQPAEPERFASRLGSRIAFGGEYNRLSFFTSDIVDHLVTANSGLARVNDEQVEQYLASFLDQSVAHSVVEQIVAQLPDGAPSQKQVASMLNMSSRTLQRKLREEGTSFLELLQDTRCQLACKYLAQPGRSVVEIAYTLGFSEPSTFSRAFKRWSGQAPADYRREMLQN